jgi:hypothetical protein
MVLQNFGHFSAEKVKYACCCEKLIIKILLENLFKELVAFRKPSMTKICSESTGICDLKSVPYATVDQINQDRKARHYNAASEFVFSQKHADALKKSYVLLFTPSYFRKEPNIYELRSYHLKPGILKAEFLKICNFIYL